MNLILITGFLLTFIAYLLFRRRIIARMSTLFVLLVILISYSLFVSSIDPSREITSELKRKVNYSDSRSLDYTALQWIDSLGDLVSEYGYQNDSLARYVSLLEQDNSTLGVLSETRMNQLDSIKRLYDFEAGLARNLIDSLSIVYRDQIDQGEMEIEMLKDHLGTGVKFNLPEHIVFPVGGAELSQLGQRTLASSRNALSLWLSNENHIVRIEGHTDSIPISTGQFRSNWDLSAMRAASVARFMMDELRLNPRQLEVTGLAEFFPKHGNSTDKGRAANRRIEIYLEPRPLRLSLD